MESQLPDDVQAERKALLAWAYAERGWPVLPLHAPLPEGGCSCHKGAACGSVGKHPLTAHGLKDASTDHAVLADWYRQWPFGNMAVVTGAASGLVVLDVDPRHGGEASLAALQRRCGALPPTLSATTGGGGRHLFFRHPGGTVPNSAGKLGPGLDMRGDGGYITVFPSVHASGNEYRWDADLSACPPAEMPGWLTALVQRTAPSPVPRDDAAASQPLLPGTRNEQLFLAACSLRDRQLAPEAVLRAVQAINAESCRPPLPADELRALVKNALAYDGTVDWTLTDLGNAERLVQKHGDILRYAAGEGRWYLWDGRRWAPDGTRQVWRLAHLTARELSTLADALPSGNAQQKTLRQHARYSESERGTRAMLGQAQAYLATPPGAFDADPWAFNCANGTLELRQGALRPHMREHLLTRLSPVEYHPDAPCPRWQQFLREIFAGDDALISFVQRAVGYTLTGDVREQCLFFMYGDGRNGKSTFIETLMAVFGGYQQKAPAEMLLAKPYGAGIPNDIAQLPGARLVVAAEVEEGRRLAESLVKDLTGGDTLTARFLHQEFFRFRPTHTLWLYGNHKPVVRGSDDGIWRRMRLIPFTVQIPPAQVDPQLKMRLRDELPGILAWAVRGCADWQRDGLTPPAPVRQATDAYRAEMDTVAQFVQDACTLLPTAATRAGELYHAYTAWCDALGERPISQRRFSTALLRTPGVTRERLESHIQYIGIRLG